MSAPRPHRPHRPHRPWVRLGAALALALILLPASPARQARADGAWPFGGASGPRIGGRGRDLYNLGLLGAKARDDAAEAPAPLPTSGGPVVRRGGRGPAPEPEALVVEILFPGGPAEEAGIAVGDVIVGEGRSTFRGSALDALAEALVDAERGREDGVLTLLVERAGSDDHEKVEVAIPVGGRALRDPTDGEGRQRIFADAAAWLAGRQRPDGGFAETLSGVNGAVVQAALAGLVWLAAGSTDEDGRHDEHVDRAARFVIEQAGVEGAAGLGLPAGARAGMDQTNWGLAHAAIFLGELELARPDASRREELFRIAAALAERQEPSGGWAHGPGGPNPLGYTELNIVTGLALCGMGMAARAGWEVPEEVLERAEAYLETSASGDGGVGYSTEPGQRGMGNIGRTAAAWLGYRLLGRERARFARKMESYVERHAGEVMGGHASLMQHVLLAGLAAHANGRRATSAFWEAMERDLVLARAPDGSLQPRPWHESLTMGTNSDVMFGEVWTTAAWALVLGCTAEEGRRGLPGWLGEDVEER